MVGLMRKSIRREIRRNGQFYNLFFIRPKDRTDTQRYAEKLASMKNVAEVMVTEGECGFIVKARSASPEARSVVEQSLARTSYKKIVSYYQYRR
jgi:hypothetical protein